MMTLENAITAHENQYARPLPMYSGRTVFVCACGPSLALAAPLLVEASLFDLNPRFSREPAIIAVNSAFKAVISADLVFFTDYGWFSLNRAALDRWTGFKYTSSRRAKREAPEMVHRIKLTQDFRAPRRFLVQQAEVTCGRTSGHTAIALAIAMRAKRVVLVGFDMRLIDGREHFHDEYPKTGRDLNLYETTFLPAFAGWQAAAIASGVEIVNATEGSAVKEFPFVDLRAELEKCMNP